MRSTNKIAAASLLFFVAAFSGACAVEVNDEEEAFVEDDDAAHSSVESPRGCHWFCDRKYRQCLHRARGDFYAQSECKTRWELCSVRCIVPGESRHTSEMGPRCSVDSCWDAGMPEVTMKPQGRVAQGRDE